MKLPLLRHTTLIAAFLASSASAWALDGKLVLERLVAKGVLTAEEADDIIRADREQTAAAEKKVAAVTKAAAISEQVQLPPPANTPKPAVATTKESSTRKITVAGKVQVQAKAIVTDARNSDMKKQVRQGFEMRRMDIAVGAEIGENWSAIVDYRAETNSLSNSSGTVQADAGFQIDKAWIEYDTKDYGQFQAGIRKAPMGYEETVSSSYLLPIERGIVNNYFVGNSSSTATATSPGGYNITSGERRMGLYYDSARTKDIEKKGGAKFGAAFTNDLRRRFDNNTNDFSYYLHGLYVHKFKDDTFLDFGVNTAYSDSEVQAKAPAIDNEGNGVNSFVGEVYTRLRTGNLTLFAEVYQAWIENGRTANGPSGVATTTEFQDAMPFGAVFMASYLIDDRFEPVFSMNYLDTKGRGVRPEQVIRDAVSTGATSAAGVYDSALSFYTGFNWYFTQSKSLKLSMGFETHRFFGREQGVTAEGRADVYGGRMQLQALF